ncbi:unnamed protein product, partial [Brenthis ino]
MTERTQRTVLNSQTREFVIRLRNYFDREAQNGGPILPITSVVERVADALNIGQRTVRRITKKKYGETGTEENKLHTPKKRKRAKPVVGIDSFDADAIRRHVYGYYLQKDNEYSTDFGQPSGSWRTFNNSSSRGRGFNSQRGQRPLLQQMQQPPKQKSMRKQRSDNRMEKFRHSKSTINADAYQEELKKT